MQDLILSPVPVKELLQSISDIVENKVSALLQADKELPFQDKEYLTGKEVELVLSISAPTRYEWEKKGLFSRYKISGRTRYKRSEIIQAFQKMK